MRHHAGWASAITVVTAIVDRKSGEGDRRVKIAARKPHHLVGNIAPTLVALACAAIVWLVLAGGASAQMRCSILNAVGPRFAAYDTLGASPVESAGYVAFRCENVGLSDTIVIELSPGEGNSAQRRRMSRGDERLNYNLYLDAARTLIWGDGTRGTGRYQTRPIEGRTELVPIYGRIPPRQTRRPGSCSDSVVLTVKY